MNLPTGWISTELGSISTKIGSGATPAGGQASYVSIGVPLIRSMNVHFGGFEQNGLVYLNDAQARALIGVTVHAKDVLLNITGASIGRVCLAPDVMVGARVNQHVCIIRLTGELLPSYVERFLASPEMQKWILEENYGFTRQALTKGMIEQLAIPIPPRAEQRRIVTKLDRLFVRLARARVETEKALELVSRERAAILNFFFSRNAAGNWAYVSIEEILTEGQIGLVRSKEAQHQSGVPYIRMNHYDSEGRWNEDKLTFVSCTPEERKRFSLRHGDVLFNTRNSVELVGKVAIWPPGKEGYVFNNNLLRMRFRKEASPDFVALSMMSPAFQEQLSQQKSATTSVAAIYLRNFYKMRIPLPDIETQANVAETIRKALGRLENLIVEARRARALLDRLEAAILTKAFKGELVPQDPNDEPASLLLERIRAQRAAKSPVEKARRRTASKATA